jgi:hypothetical protein
MTDLLRRAWATLDTFKQAYPENWHEDDEQVLKDLMRADLKLSGVKLKWHGLTDEEVSEIIDAEIGFNSCWGPEETFARAIEAKLKEKNNE